MIKLCVRLPTRTLYLEEGIISSENEFYRQFYSAIVADLKAGKRPKKGEPRLKTAKELELEDLIELELEKLTIPELK